MRETVFRGTAAIIAVSLCAGSHVFAQAIPPPGGGGIQTLPIGPPATAPPGSMPVPAGAVAPPNLPLASSPAIAQISKELAGRPITMNEAVSLALATSPDLALASQNLYQAEGRTGQVESQLRPTIMGTAGDLYLANALRAGGTIVGTLPLDIAGLLRAATSQARFQEIMYRLAVNATRNQIVYNVQSAFFNVLRAKALVAVATDNLQNSLDRLRDAELKYKVRTAPYFDVVRAQTDVADAQRQVIQARNRVSVSTADLNRAMGVDITTSLQITDTAAVEQPPGVAPPSIPAPQSTPGTPTPPGQPSPVMPPSAPPPGASPAAATDSARANAAGRVAAPGALPGEALPAPNNPAAQTGGASAAGPPSPALALGQQGAGGLDAQQLPAVPPPSSFNPSSASLTAPTQALIINQALSLGPEFKPLLAEGLASRPEIQEGDSAIEAAKKGIYLAHRSQLPGLSFSLGYYDVRNSTGSQWINEPEALLSITWQLYDGGLARERVKEAQGILATAITRRRQAADAVTIDVQDSYLNVVQTRDQVSVANQALSQAREAYNIAVVRYNAGVASRTGVSPLIEVSNAQAALTLAESNQVNALYDYNSARAELNRALGRFAFNSPGKPR